LAQMRGDFDQSDKNFGDYINLLKGKGNDYRDAIKGLQKDLYEK